MSTQTERFVVTVPVDEASPPVVPLPQGALPCRVCGIAVEDGAGVPAAPIVVNTYGGRERVLVSQESQSTVLCSSCVATEAEARRLRGELMLFGVPLELLVAALQALDLLGGSAVTFTDDQDVVRLIEHLPAAAMVAFGGHAAIGTCAARRWSHVDPLLKRTLREGAARWMKQRLERPVPVAPPASSERRGCLLCGVGTVMALPSRANDIWTEYFVSASALGGGNGSSGSVDGHTCPACTQAIDATDGAGVAALQAAVLRFVGYERRSMTPPVVSGIRGWGLQAGVKPNRAPWAHADIAGLRRSLAAFERGVS